MGWNMILVKNLTRSLCSKKKKVEILKPSNSNLHKNNQEREILCAYVVYIPSPYLIKLTKQV